MKTQKTAEELTELHRDLLNEMLDRQQRASQDIWEEYMPELRRVSGWLREALAKERLAKMQEGTPPNQYSKQIAKNGCLI